MAHTPGPWYQGPTGPMMRIGYSQPLGITQQASPKDKPTLIAGIFGDVRGGEAVAQANARLIAAAPDLLNALKSLVKIYGCAVSLETSSACITIACTAIEKAEGR